MITAEGVEEAPRIGSGAPGRHAAWGQGAERRGAGRRPAWVVVPALCSAVFAGAAVLLVLNGAHSAGYRIGGGTMTAVWILGIGILAVAIGTLALAGRAAEPAPRHPAGPDPMLFAPQAPPGVQPVPQAPPVPEPPPAVVANAAEAAAVMSAVNSPAVPAPVSEEGVDLQVIFAQLVRRLLTLVLQQINRLDELENEVEDPKLLKSLFGIDHQATQVRRYGENIGVLVGAMPQRQWTQPVPVTVAQRSAVSETPDYPRVQVIPRAPGRIHGHAVSDVIHILSELVENATNYSNPNTKVTVGAHRVAAGLAIEVNDHGIGMEQDQFSRLNTLLRDPSGANVRDLLSQGRIGLSVVAKMAQRHGIAVELQPNVTGGTMALVVLPDALLAPEEQPADDRRPRRRAVDTTQLPAKPALAPIAAAVERTPA
ncbi:MAG: sensor histidine kinase, partial [Catenulispora sp.]|nr:sensor histidine kinase [Catenulispora sp.]